MLAKPVHDLSDVGMTLHNDNFQRSKLDSNVAMKAESFTIG